MATIHVNGPGKTTPKLLADFLQFDPQKNTGSNILTTHPPPVGEGQAPAPHRDACKHEYTFKSSQSVTPPLDTRPDASSQYKLAVVCKKCRLHVDIQVNYQQATSPCPTSENQLHHFQRADGLDDNGHAHIRYGWQCSSAACQAILTTTFKLPKISAPEKNLLTDTSKLKSRFEAVMADDPEREGIRQASPVDALTRLRKYIKDALNPEHDKRVFPGNNKRFMEAYGVQGRDCRELLQRLGFQYNVRAVVECTDDRVTDRTQDQEMNWALPNPPTIEGRLGADGSSLREQLEDVEMELVALAWRTAAEMNVVNPVAGEGWHSAQRDLERILGTQGCKFILFSFWTSVLALSLLLFALCCTCLAVLSCSRTATNGSLQMLDRPHYVGQTLQTSLSRK
jgi:ubiquitin carboxyl-terminal hydrolase 25/28